MDIIRFLNILIIKYLCKNVHFPLRRNQTKDKSTWCDFIIPDEIKIKILAAEASLPTPPFLKRGKEDGTWIVVAVGYYTLFQILLEKDSNYEIG